MFNKIKIFMSKNKKQLLMIGSILLIIFIISIVFVFQSIRNSQKQTALVHNNFSSTSKLLECGSVKYNPEKKGCCSSQIYDLKIEECCSTCSDSILDISLESRDLSIEDVGYDVEELQNFLTSNGFLVMPAESAPGYFGELTQIALKKFQTANNLPSTGYFGSMTRNKIIEISKSDKKMLEKCLLVNNKIVNFGECSKTNGVVVKSAGAKTVVVDRKSSSGHGGCSASAGKACCNGVLYTTGSWQDTNSDGSIGSHERVCCGGKVVVVGNNSRWTGTVCCQNSNTVKAYGRSGWDCSSTGVCVLNENKVCGGCANQPNPPRPDYCVQLESAYMVHSPWNNQTCKYDDFQWTSCGANSQCNSSGTACK